MKIFWWTGKDLHLRNSQGVPALQAGGFIYSPTHPQICARQVLGTTKYLRDLLRAHPLYPRSKAFPCPDLILTQTVQV